MWKEIRVRLVLDDSLMLVDARATLPGHVQLAILNAWLLDISLGLVQQRATFEPRHHTCCYLNLATKCRPLSHPVLLVVLDIDTTGQPQDIPSLRVLVQNSFSLLVVTLPSDVNSFA